MNASTKTSKLKTLIKMQLKEKINLSFLANKKQAFFKIMFSILGFAAIAAIAYVVLFFCQFLNLFSISNQIPVSVMAFVLLVMYVINFISSTITLSNSLYRSEDNHVLITFPVNANLVFISKLVVHLITEIKRSFIFIVPVFFAYGLLSGLPIYYYIWMPVMICVLAVLTVLMAGVISIPWAMFMRFLDRFKIIKIIICVLLLATVGYFAFVLISKIPSNINLIESWREISIFIRQFLSKFIKIFSFVYAFAIFLCGTVANSKIVFFTKYTYIVLLAMIGLIALFLLLNMLLSRPVYLRMISSSFEYKKSQKKARKNVKLASNASPVLYELKTMLRQAETINSSLISIVVAPIAILALNKIYGAINTRMLGSNLTIAFNVLIILLFTLSANISVSSIYSKEGESFYLNKVIPKKPYQILFSRLAYNGTLALVLLLLTCPIFFYFSTLSVMNKILLFISLFLISLVHLFWSAEIDFLNLQTQKFKTEGKAGINPNELKSTILSFAISLITFAIVAFFLIVDNSNFFVKLLFMAIAVLALRISLFLYKARVLFKEK